MDSKENKENKLDVNIRSYTLDDYEGVKELYVKSGQFYEKIDSFEGLQKQISKDHRSILVAVESGRVVGAVSLMEDGRTNFIYRLTVDPEKRNRGVGTTLMNAAAEELFSRGHEEINVLVDERNEDLQGWYERQGYERGNPYRWMSKERK